MSGPGVKRQRRADDPIPRGVLVDVIERLKNEERKNCDGFCALNSGAANDARLTDDVLAAILRRLADLALEQEEAY